MGDPILWRLPLEYTEAGAVGGRLSLGVSRKFNRKDLEIAP
ncbi:MAG: hypothetical protein ACFCVD_25305 [Nodosilinea sp.]